MFNFMGKVYAQAAPQVTQLDPATDIGTIFSNIITWALFMGGAVAVVYIIYGGFTYITSAGDSEKAEQGKSALTNAIIGVILISMSLVIVTWVNDWLQGRIQ